MILQMFPGVGGLLPTAPPAPGVLGVSPGSAPPPPKRSFLDKLLGVYAAGDVTKNEAEGLRKQGLIEAGLAIMAASGQGGSTGEALLAGLQQGKGAVAQRSAAIQQQDMQDRLRQIGEANPAAIPAMLQEAIVSGADPQTISALSQAARAMSAGQAASQAAAPKPTVLSEGQILVDPETGEVIKAGRDRPTGFTLSPGQIRILPDGSVIRGPDKPASTAEREAATKYGAMAPSVANIEELWPQIAEEGGLQWIDLARYRYSGPGQARIRSTLSNEKQAFIQASETLATQVARALFGARVTEQQREAVYRTYIIAPGDKPLNVEQTIASLKRLVEDIGAEAGGEVAARERDRVEANVIEGTSLPDPTQPVREPVEPMPEFQ